MKEKPSIHLVSWKKWFFKKKKKTKKDKKDEFIKGTKRMSKGHAITVENQGIEGVIAKSTLNTSKEKKSQVLPLQVQNHMMICFSHYLLYDTLFLLNWF